MKTFYAFKNVENQEEAEISIFDEIGFWGSNAKDFYAQLKAIKAKKIVLRINSPGGSVVDGYAIYNMLRSHSATKEVRVDGIAASIASVIAMAGDTIVMPEKFDRESGWSQTVRNAKDFTQVLYQLGLGAAAIKTLRQ